MRCPSCGSPEPENAIGCVNLGCPSKYRCIAAERVRRAAPELLAACEEMLSCWSDGFSHSVRTKARAAVAKAKGTTP